MGTKWCRHAAMPAVRMRRPSCLHLCGHLLLANCLFVLWVSGGAYFLAFVCLVGHCSSGRTLSLLLWGGACWWWGRVFGSELVPDFIRHLWGGHCIWGLEGGCLCGGENFDFVITYTTDWVDIGRGFANFCPLLPLLNSCHCWSQGPLTGRTGQTP